jgi:hypothetical protein
MPSRQKAIIFMYMMIFRRIWGKNYSVYFFIEFSFMHISGK